MYIELYKVVCVFFYLNTKKHKWLNNKPYRNVVLKLTDFSFLAASTLPPRGIAWREGVGISQCECATSSREVFTTFFADMRLEHLASKMLADKEIC